MVANSNLDVVVVKIQHYLDFQINQYFGADMDNNPYGDIACIVLEVGSLGSNKLDVGQ